MAESIKILSYAEITAKANMMVDNALQQVLQTNDIGMINHILNNCLGMMNMWNCLVYEHQFPSYEQDKILLNAKIQEALLGIDSNLKNSIH